MVHLREKFTASRWEMPWVRLGFSVRELHSEWVGKASSLGLEMDSEMEKMGEMGKGEERETRMKEGKLVLVCLFF